MSTSDTIHCTRCLHQFDNTPDCIQYHFGFKRNNVRYLVCVACRNKLKFDRTNKKVPANPSLNANPSIKPVEKCPICLDDNNNPVSFSCGHSVCSECYENMVEKAKNNHENDLNRQFNVGTGCTYYHKLNCHMCRRKHIINDLDKQMFAVIGIIHLSGGVHTLIKHPLEVFQYMGNYSLYKTRDGRHYICEKDKFDNIYDIYKSLVRVLDSTQKNKKIEVLNLYLYVNFRSLGKDLILTVDDNYDDDKLGVKMTQEDEIDAHMITPFDVATDFAQMAMEQLGTDTFRGVSFKN